MSRSTRNRSFQRWSLSRHVIALVQTTKLTLENMQKTTTNKLVLVKKEMQKKQKFNLSQQLYVRTAVCAHIILTVVIHNAGQNSSDDLPSYSPDSHCSGACSTAHRIGRPNGPAYSVRYLLDKYESCPTADLSNIGRPNGPAYSVSC